MTKRIAQHSAQIALAMLFIGFLLGTQVANAARDKSSAPIEVAGVVGAYYISGGYGGATLTLAPDQTFTYEEDDDTTKDVKWAGTYRVEHNLLTLHPSSEIGVSAEARRIINQDGVEKKEEYRWSGPLVLHCLLWGRRLYLLSDEEMPLFCNDVNLGYEPRGTIMGKYFVRASPSTLSRLPHVRSLPLLPVPWSVLVLSHPVMATVLAVVQEQQKGTTPGTEILTVTLNKGARAGLKAGMVFASRQDFGGAEMVIRAVQMDQCIAEGRSSEPNSEIRVGTRFSTRMSKKTVKRYQGWPKYQRGGG